MHWNWSQTIVKFAIHIAMLFVYSASQLANSAGIEAHEHGVSELTIVMEAGVVELALQTPAADLVGFEHKAKSAEDIALVKRIANQLDQANGLFSLHGGQCRLMHQTVDVSAVLAQKDSHHHEHAAEKHAHGHDDEHSEITMNYRYQCKKMRDISSIKVSLFKTYPSIKQIRVMWVKPTQQGAATLTTDNSVVYFR